MVAACLTKGLKRSDRLVHLLNDGQGGTCHRTYTCHTARSTATTTTTRRCASMTFCARASFETFLASSRITQCAKKRLLCQGQRQDSPQVARASDASRTMGFKLSSSATRFGHSSMHSALCQTQLKYRVYIVLTSGTLINHAAYK